MSLRDRVSRRLPNGWRGLLLVSAAVAVVQVGLALPLSVAVGSVPGLFAPFVGTVALGVLAVLTLPLYVGVYVPFAEGVADDRAVIRSAFGAIRRHYRDLFAADLAAGVVAVLSALTAALAWFVASTAARYWRYATGDPVAQPFMRPITEMQVVFFATFVCVLALVRFADLLVAFGDSRPALAWRDSLSFVRERPLSFVAFTGLTLALLALASLTRPLFEQISRPPNLAWYSAPEAVAVAVIYVVLVALAVSLAPIAHALLATARTAYFERAIGPAGVAGTARSIPVGRLVLVACLLVAALGAATYVRANDLGTGQEPIEPLPDDPSEAYAVAAENTEDANHRRVRLLRNENRSDSEFREVRRFAIDYDHRRLSITHRYRPTTVEGWYSESLLASRPRENTSGIRGYPFERTVGQWRVAEACGYGLLRMDDPGRALAADGNVTLQRRNESALVYRVDRPERVSAALARSGFYARAELADESYVTVTVDRERGVIDRFRARVSHAERDHDRSYVVRYENVGSTTVERPEAFGHRRPVEWFWEVVYY